MLLKLIQKWINPINSMVCIYFHESEASSEVIWAPDLYRLCHEVKREGGVC